MESAQKEEAVNPNFVKVQISPSDRAECRGCKRNINKKEIRLAICFDDGLTRSYPWHHLECFYTSGSFRYAGLQYKDIKGIELLEQKDRLLVEDRIDKLLSGQIKKTKFNSNKKAKNPEDDQKEQARYKQGGYTERERMQFNDFIVEYGKKNMKQLQSMLQLNLQLKSGNKQQVVERVADGLLLGSIPSCSQCKRGHLIFNRYNGSYKCKGYFDEEKGSYHRCKGKFKRNEIERAQFA